MPPIIYMWNGIAMIPLPRFQYLYERFERGQRYRLQQADEASTATRGHYFAQLHEIWLNLPEDIASDFLNERHFRKWLLIKTGYANKRHIVCVSPEEARRVASEFGSDYDMVIVNGNVVEAIEAQSQSKRDMGGKIFQASKDAVLDYGVMLIGLTREELEANAGRSA